MTSENTINLFLAYVVNFTVQYFLIRISSAVMASN